MTKNPVYHPLWRRAFFSFSLIVTVMAVGTLGMQAIERISLLDAFYFMSMLATSQGPTYIPQTALGKIFASFMAFISVGAVVASVGFLFGPFLGELWHVGVKRFEERISARKSNQK